MHSLVPFVDLNAQYLQLKSSIDEAIAEVLSCSNFILGPVVENFEHRFADFIGVKEAIGVGTGTDALTLVFQALGIGPGDQVLVPANTFIASALGVHMAGAEPVPVDVDSNTHLLDLEQAATRITYRTKAILPVHLYGMVCDMGSVGAFADAHKLHVVEDAAQAHGAIWNSKRAGSFGIAGCFSFFPSKNLGGFGDGGMVLTNDLGVAERIRLLRNYGSTKKYIHDIAGTNSRLDAIQAAVLNVKLDQLDKWNQRRIDVAGAYYEGLSTINEIHQPYFDRNSPGQHVFHLYVVRVRNRDDLIAHLKEQGIATGVHYPVPFFLQEAFSFLGYSPGFCVKAEQLSSEVLSLPMFPEITSKQVKVVIDAIKSFYE